MRKKKQDLLSQIRSRGTKRWSDFAKAAQEGCSRAGRGTRAPWAPLCNHRLSVLPAFPSSLYGTWSDLHKIRAQRPTWLGGENGEKRKTVYFSFCYFISLQWEQLKTSRINENNCWASIQVVNKEPWTLLSPKTKRCWHKKNSIFLHRNHFLNSLVLKRIPCFLPVHFTHTLKTNHSVKIQLKSYVSY